ncbi:hypothetical protein Saso_66170 [Streptomyces asoensis]|uniref:Uncharacterized protein n=1 Tax=Streptomyces asoensis TaxID=249586 RepID=A0ABQ3SAJ7_9ACTN|nr:hypothetical protein GCM10010496_70790 [Streptomyces asoensis]GHI64967.1 hypothetical protein Saso_66170 [Streptomyces asoensis]
MRSRKDALAPPAGTVCRRREPPSLRRGFASPYLPKGGPPVRLVTRGNTDTAAAVPPVAELSGFTRPATA